VHNPYLVYYFHVWLAGSPRGSLKKNDPMYLILLPETPWS
jgi:hypothetical protein